jgi:hypothetical protein
MAWTVDEAANFVVVQLIEQEPGVYEKCLSDYARLDRADLAWEIGFSWDEGVFPN